MLFVRPELREVTFCSVLAIGAFALLLFRFGSPRRAAAVLLGVLVLDQLSQCLAARYFLFTEGPIKRISLFGGWMLLSYVENWYLGFGRTGQDLLLLTVLMVVCLLVLYRRLARSQYRMPLLTELAFALLTAGLLGILIDRVRIGYVVDFIRLFHGVSMTCNLADLSAIAAGVLLAVRGALLLHEKLAGAAAAPAVAPGPHRPTELNPISAMLVCATLVLVVIWRAWPI